MEPERQEFGRYVLDVRRGCLLLDGREVTLRPKTFAVLTYLAARPGQLVSKEELFAAVWPNLVVTDDTLVQSIGELRRALGENGAAHDLDGAQARLSLRRGGGAAGPPQIGHVARAALAVGLWNPGAARR